MTQRHNTFTLNNTTVPALETDLPIKDSVIIILHGSDVSKEVNQIDMDRLETAGFWSVAIDAPHHGERADGYMEIANKANPREQYLMMLYVVHQEASEVAELVKVFKSQGKKVAVLGISMGAYATHALMTLSKEADLFVTFMGNPDFRHKRSNTYSALETTGPMDSLDKIFPANLFMVVAGQDEFVDPSGARSFYEKLRTFYKNCPEKLVYLEYPESSHMMRPEDWFNAWEQLINYLKRFGF